MKIIPLGAPFKEVFNVKRPVDTFFTPKTLMWQMTAIPGHLVFDLDSRRCYIDNSRLGLFIAYSCTSMSLATKLAKVIVCFLICLIFWLIFVLVYK